MTSSDPSAPFTCTRWTRFGHDRLYVTSPTGEGLGHRDLRTDTVHPLDEADRALVQSISDAWVTSYRSRPGQPPAPAAPTRAVSAVPDAAESFTAPRPWQDLSLNRPGAAAREVALAKRAEAPVRTTLARLLRVHNDERAWRVGADGEELVAAQLDRLAARNPAWTALHAVPVGNRGADIDHLVIGPGGVFTVNAKHHRGADIWVGGDTLMVNGTRTHHVRNARFEAERASRLLSTASGQHVHVEGLVVTVNAGSFQVKAQPQRGVTVLYRKQLATWLSQRGTVLDQDLLNRIWDVARRSTTWQC